MHHKDQNGLINDEFNVIYNLKNTTIISILLIIILYLGVNIIYSNNLGIN